MSRDCNCAACNLKRRQDDGSLYDAMLKASNLTEEKIKELRLEVSKILNGEGLSDSTPSGVSDINP